MLDLWPEDIGYAESKLKAPVTILREQASLLGKKTKNLVEAQVRAVGSDVFAAFNYSFYIVAPALGPYRYRLFGIAHDVQLYPVEIHLDNDIRSEILPNDPKGRLIAQSESEFLEVLKKIFSAEKTKQVIQALLAQLSFEEEIPF